MQTAQINVHFSTCREGFQTMTDERPCICHLTGYGRFDPELATPDLEHHQDNAIEEQSPLLFGHAQSREVSVD